MPCWTPIRLCSPHATAPTPADGAVPSDDCSEEQRETQAEAPGALCTWREHSSGWGRQGGRQDEGHVELLREPPEPMWFRDKTPSPELQKHALTLQIRVLSREDPLSDAHRWGLPGGPSS